MNRYVAPPGEWDCGILLSNIKRNGKPYCIDLALPLDGSVEYWGQSYMADGPVSVSITANYAGENIVVRVELEGNFLLPCSRCLCETGLAINGDMRYLFTLRPAVDEGGRHGRHAEPDDDDDAPDGDVDVIVIDGYNAELDLSSYVWETLILNLPEKVLCGEDCLGLCPICGGNRNITGCGCVAHDTDPRFEVLRDLGSV
ncbi:MAG: DUF177 domain-containing protein [Synergistaceae bacterium]|jgi:uncharacterized protein|nr:DUF177 domain-containing protein [Synergistaceae bacterium]